MEQRRRTVLVLIFNGVEELEAVGPVDLLRRAGAEVTVASAGAETRVTGRSVLNLEADCPLEAVLAQQFDLVVLPGGPGVRHLRASPEVLRLLRMQVEAERLVGAICAAPVVLQEAGVLEGRRCTGHPSIAADLPRLDEHSPVVRDGPVITSRGAGTAILFGLALVEALFDGEMAASLARSICHPA
jgi:4-methyl-5(b-hydroxyethyl)-thiazole monophosphate biosynthesis